MSLLKTISSLRKQALKATEKSKSEPNDYTKGLQAGIAIGYTCSADIVEIQFSHILSKIYTAEDKIIEQEVKS